VTSYNPCRRENMSIIDTKDGITKAIHRSQHCQRNWDLTREIPEEDMKVLIEAVTQCPSKQNAAFYDVYFVTNREIIESIYAETDGFGPNPNLKDMWKTNSQTLANLLVVFTAKNPATSKDVMAYRSQQIVAEKKGEADVVATSTDPTRAQILERDANVALGIAAGYLNLTASMLGYRTGCCQCYNPTSVRKLIGSETKPLLLMGVGFNNPELNRRVHHMDHEFVFPTKPKQPINVTEVK
jgi:ferredoxin